MQEKVKDIAREIRINIFITRLRSKSISIYLFQDYFTFNLILDRCQNGFTYTYIDDCYDGEISEKQGIKKMIN